MRKVYAYGLATALLLALTRFETNMFVSGSFSVLRLGSWMAALIFAHNSLAATAVTVSICFYMALVEALPERFRKKEVLVVKHAKIFSVALAVFLVFNSVFMGVGMVAFQFIHLWLPVAVVEVCGLYLATFYPLQKRVSLTNMVKVYAVFLVGALVETAVILYV